MKVLLLFVFFLFSSNAYSGVCKVNSFNSHCQGKKLVKAARKVFKNQPILYANAEFAEFQEFTLWSQRLAKKSGILYQVLSNPSMSSSHYLLNEYKSLYVNIEKLVEELPAHLVTHYQMNPEGAQEIWIEKLNRTIDSIESGEFPEYAFNDCDYTSQPLNYLWFGLHALKILNEIGETQYAGEWPNKIDNQTELLSYDVQELKKAFVSSIE